MLVFFTCLYIPLTFLISNVFSHPSFPMNIALLSSLTGYHSISITLYGTLEDFISVITNFPLLYWITVLKSNFVSIGLIWCWKKCCRNVTSSPSTKTIIDCNAGICIYHVPPIPENKGEEWRLWKAREFLHHESGGREKKQQVRKGGTTNESKGIR